MTKQPRIPRNWLLAVIAKEDPTRYRTRVVRPETGKGRKTRPRQKKHSEKGWDE